MAKQYTEKMHKEDEQKAEVLAALSHPLRLRMALELYKNGPRNVKGFVELLGVSQPAVSQHLTRMRLSGVVEMKKEGTKVIYSVDDPRIKQLLDVFYD